MRSVRLLLEDLDFQVADVDQTLKPGEPKREDLRIVEPMKDVSVILAEVKGYPYDAKTSDLKQVREQREVHIKNSGDVPISWWIVNDHRSTADPSERGSTLQGQEELLYRVVAVPTRVL